MKLKIHITKTRIPTYRSRLWIIVASNLPAAFELIEDEVDIKVHDPKTAISTKAYTFACQDEVGRRTFMLFFRANPTHGEIAHEVKHLVNMIFSWHGVKLSLTNDEAECYFLERVTNKVYSAINKYKKLYRPVNQRVKNKQETIPQILENKVENT